MAKQVKNIFSIFKKDKEYTPVKENHVYRFLCQTCDIFFENEKYHQNRCPICGRPSIVYSVLKYDSKGNIIDDQR